MDQSIQFNQSDQADKKNLNKSIEKLEDDYSNYTLKKWKQILKIVV